MNLSLSERWKDMKACYSSCPIPPSPLKSTLRIDAPHNRCSGHYHYHHHCRLHRKGDKTLSPYAFTHPSLRARAIHLSSTFACSLQWLYLCIYILISAPCALRVVSGKRRWWWSVGCWTFLQWYMDCLVFSIRVCLFLQNLSWVTGCHACHVLACTSLRLLPHRLNSQW